MTKYLLTEEKKQIDILLKQLEKELYIPNTQELKPILLDIIKNNKDSSPEELISTLLDLLIKEIKPILDTNLTPGIQFGIKTNHFLLESYGGNVTQETFFSFDSISKIITAIITMYNIRNNNFTLNTTINNYNKDYNLNATIESILKFTAHIRTEKRIENLSKDETISILKKCKENIEEKQKYKNFYEYNDIGYMILRQIIPNFIQELEQLLQQIDNQNLTYINNTPNITGGTKNNEHITPDKKGREIIFPGHTGLYGNITGLLNLFDKLTHTNIILTEQEKELLWKQPYTDPYIYDKENNKTQKYMAKIAGIYRLPKGITTPSDKLKILDIPNNTTSQAKASTGTCGSWTISDNNIFGPYTSAILTNPYSYVKDIPYPNNTNIIPNTPLEVNKKGVIISYSEKLNKYKKILTNYSLLLELLTEYIKLTPNSLNSYHKLTKKIQ